MTAPRRTIDQLLEEARSGLERVDPHQAQAAVQSGAVIVDVRSELQRATDGTVPGAVHHPRNVLEWRCDPASDARDERLADLDRHLIVMCDEGYASSLAAASLQELGREDATDLIGGFQAWRAAGRRGAEARSGSSSRADCRSLPAYAARGAAPSPSSATAGPAA